METETETETSISTSHCVKNIHDPDRVRQTLTQFHQPRSLFSAQCPQRLATGATTSAVWLSGSEPLSVWLSGSDPLSAAILAGSTHAAPVHSARNRSYRHRRDVQKRSPCGGRPVFARPLCSPARSSAPFERARS